MTEIRNRRPSHSPAEAPDILRYLPAAFFALLGAVLFVLW